jgi:large subunit ribosomal protein L13
MTKKNTPFTTKEAALANRKWFVVDAENKVLGRLAAEVARILHGKHKASSTPHQDDGDFVVIVNASKVKLTGNKATGKKYFRHTGFAGGIKEENAKTLLARRPEQVILQAVQGMLPRGPLGNQMGTKVKVYAGADHPHAAQQPQEMGAFRL